MKTKISKGKEKLMLMICPLIWIIYYIAYTIFYPVITIDQAVNQLEDSDSSFISYQTYQTIWDNLWIVLLILTIVILLKTIKSKIKNNSNKEEK